MTLVEQHTVKAGSEAYRLLDQEAYKSKNLYNATLYAVRQQFFENRSFLNYNSLQAKFQSENQPDYYALPAKVAQQTMKMVDQNFRAFFKAIKAYKKDKSKFKGVPKLPKYLDKEKGRYLLTYTNQAISKKMLANERRIKLSGIDVSVPTDVTYEQLKQVRVVRKLRSYVIEIVYDDGKEAPLKEDNGRYAAIDLGVSNLATVTSNIDGFEPFIVDGRELKSINRYYNKELAEKKSILETRNGVRYSNKTRALTEKRNNKVKDYIHKASRVIVNQLASNDVCKLVVGYNQEWKQDANIGSRNNQNFVQIPFLSFLNMLKYKCQKEGIEVVTVNESHTSKCSFLDGEEICHHDKYVGRRVKRGLFSTESGFSFNADVNGSYNILRKCIPEAFADGVEGVLVHPRITKIRN